jgi:DNA-binding MarR family transcriptional regulator
MNINDEKSLDTYRSFLLLSEIAGEEPLSQREISRRLGIAVGLVNSYLKNLVAKGYVRVKNFPSNRYAYLLTPQGLAEKSRLAYQHLSYFTNLYTVARQDYLELFRRLEAGGTREVFFCGVDEVAEIAYLSLRETGIELLQMMDNSAVGADFFGRAIQPITGSNDRMVVITSLKRAVSLRDELLKQGVPPISIAELRGNNNISLGVANG